MFKQRLRSKTLFAITLSAVALCSTHAFAQSTTLNASLPSELRTELSTAHFRTGMRYFDAGRFAEAAVEFERVYEFSSQPEILYNVARAYEGAGNYRRAVETYERVISLAPEGIELASVRQDIDRLRPLMAQQPTTSARTTGGCGENTANSQAESTSPTPTSLPPLRQLRTRRVFERSALQEVGPWISIAVGLSFGGVALWQGLTAINHNSLIDQANRGRIPWSISVDQAFGSVGFESAISFGLAAAGGVALVGGSVWLGMRGRGVAREVVVSAMSTRTATGVVVGGVF